VQWLEDYHVDGLRFDAVNYIRSVDGVSHSEGNQLADGWAFLQWLSDEIHARQPTAFTIAEDLQRLAALVAPTSQGGAGFSAQWDADFVHTVRAGIIASTMRTGTSTALAAAGRGGNSAWTSRVLYTESHDEIANGKARVPETIHPGDADSWWAKKRSMIGSALVLTAPGVPMIFQGQEMLEDSYFRDDAWLDWSKAETNSGLVALHRHLISLRRNRDGRTGGLRGPGLALIRSTTSARSSSCTASTVAARAMTSSSRSTSPTGPCRSMRSACPRPAGGRSSSTPTPSCMRRTSAVTRCGSSWRTARRWTGASSPPCSRSGPTASCCSHGTD
jgi:1,4-alpha-glucan branching enzyme